jgi:hypothetical protein
LKFLGSRRGKVALSAALVLLLFVTRPGAQSLRARLVRSLGLALNRQVEVSRVNIRLLPQPSFELSDFVVHDDPAFGAEPVLRAQEVTATVRMSSFLHLRALLRGQFEIARLSLSEPSFNLVRNAEGHWNVEDLLERAAKNPLAPTTKPKGEARPAFPYIEASHARVNFKVGLEKKAYALTDADVALWQDSENAWGMRLKAQPVRTDLTMTDTGFLRVEGSWQRAAALHETPLRFSVQWDHAQLGQATKLAFGRDKGWRGTLTVSLALEGAPANLAVTTDASVDDFRRSDIAAGSALRLATHCDARYSSADRLLRNVGCRAPVDDGIVTIEGDVAALPDFPTYDLAIEAKNVPLPSLVALVRRAKRNLPGDLVATGVLNASARLTKKPDEADGHAVWQGEGETSGLSLYSKSTRTELNLDRVPFSVVNVAPERKPGSARRREPAINAVEPIELQVGPFNVALGRPTPAKVQGRVSRLGYNFAITGDAEIQKLLALARTAGLQAPPLAANGQTRVDLQVAGNWSGFAAPQITGGAQLHSVRAEVRGLSDPLEIAAANLQLTQDEIRVTNLTASAGESTWHGSMTLSRPCASPASCPIRFDLHSARIATDELGQLFNPHPGKRPWYGFLSPAPAPGNSYFRSLRASGKIAVDQVLIHKLTATQVSARVEIENGRLQLSDLRGEVLGGKYRGHWMADFTGGIPVYAGNGVCEQFSLAQLAASMHDDWLSGTATASYQVTASGVTAAELFSSANASLQIAAHDGSFPHLVLAGGGDPLQINHFVGRLLLRDREIEIEAGKLVTPGGIYQLSGTATLDRVLDLKLAREGARGFNVTGTLAAPRVVQTPETRAALKP